MMLNKRVVFWTAVILWMGLIFFLSQQSATESTKLSTGVTEVIVEKVEKVAPNTELQIYSYDIIIRKNAHFFVYLVLGVLVMNALNSNSWWSKKRQILLTLVICISYAISDEVHQLFIPGRGAQVEDVLIDSAGASVGVLIYVVFIKIKDIEFNL